MYIHIYIYTCIYLSLDPGRPPTVELCRRVGYSEKPTDHQRIAYFALSVQLPGKLFCVLGSLPPFFQNEAVSEGGTSPAYRRGQLAEVSASQSEPFCDVTNGWIVLIYGEIDDR